MALEKISGPAFFNFVNSSVKKTVVKNLIVGTYQFELKVADDKGASARDTMLVIVDAVVASNHPPVANAGANQVITLPVSTITIDGSASTDPDNNISSYSWTKISGPTCVLPGSNGPKAHVSNLSAGQYVFELKVTDPEGLLSRDIVVVTVTGSLTPAEYNLDATINGSFVFGDNDVNCVESIWFDYSCNYFDHTTLGQINFNIEEYADTAISGDTSTNSWSIGVLPQNIKGTIISINNTIYVSNGTQVWKLEF